MLGKASQDSLPWNNTKLGLSKCSNQWVDGRWSDGNFRFVRRFILTGTDRKHISEAPSPQFAALNSCEFPCNWHVFVNSFPRLWKIMQGHFQHLKHKPWLCNANHVRVRIKGAESAGFAARDVTFVFRLFHGLLIHWEKHSLPFVARIEGIQFFKVHAVLWMTPLNTVPTHRSWDDSTVAFSLVYIMLVQYPNMYLVGRCVPAVMVHWLFTAAWMCWCSGFSHWPRFD